MWLSVLLLVAALALIASALLVWRRQGWRHARQRIVLMIVLAAAIQIVNVSLLLRGH